MNLIILGPPGAGKGTVGQMISEHYKIPLISTGELFRSAVAKETDVGIKAKSYMDAGVLVPDDLVMQIVKQRLEQRDCKDGFILDGIPRNITQAKSLEDSNIRVDAVLDFLATKEVIVDRLSTRLTCRQCGAIYNIKNVPPKKEGICDRCGGQLYQRDDQKPEIIKERIKVYEKETAPLIDYYKKMSLLRTVDANPKEPRRIFENTLKLMKK
jgi:adenylate kinase